MDEKGKHYARSAWNLLHTTVGRSPFFAEEFAYIITNTLVQRSSPHKMDAFLNIQVESGDGSHLESVCDAPGPIRRILIKRCTQALTVKR